jgi:hypothetical protein
MANSASGTHWHAAIVSADGISGATVAAMSWCKSMM